MTRKDVLKTEYSEQFDDLRKNRMVMSFYKYGPVKVNYENGLLEAIPSALRYLDKYIRTGNTEYLCDVANFLMIEFMYPQHEQAHFRATDSDESPGPVGICVNELEGKL